MKKILTFLIVMVVIGFIVAGMYVFEIPPFQPGGPFIPVPVTATQQQTRQSALPAFLTEDKVERTKTYPERITRGQLLEDNKYYSLAIAEYQQANALEPNNPEPFIKIGRIQLLTADYPKAEENLKKAVSLQPGNIDAQIYLGRTLLQERKLDEAKTVFNGISADANQTAQYYKGIMAAYFGDYENAKKLLTKAVDLGGSPDIAKKAQNYLEAFSEFDFNQGGQPSHLKTLLGRSYAQTGEYQMAIPLLFDVIKEEKDYRDAWIILGYSYLNTGKYQDAVEALEQAKILDPQNAETFFYLGLGYYGQNNLQLAASSLEQSKSLGFQPVIQVDQKLAEIYLELKQYDKSAQNYENVLALNDDNINYYIRPMWLYIEKLNQPSKAVTLAQKAFNNHPGQPMSFNLLGWAQVGNSQFDEGEKNLLQALNLDPKLDAAYLNLGLLWEKRGQYNNALAFYAKAHDLGADNSVGNAAAERYNTLIAKIKSDPNATANLDTNVGTADLLSPHNT